MYELYLKKPGDLTLREVNALSAPQDNEVKVKVIYGGICGSDIGVYKGRLPYAKYPCCPGHEILGTVVEAGKNAPQKVGTKVVSFPNTFCGECQFCLQGKTNICKNKKSFGVTVNGFFAQEVILDAKYAVEVPDDLANERAILVEPFAVNVHALKKVNITPKTSAAVFGCGPEGLLSTALLKHLGAHITVLDINENRREIAKRYGDIRAMHPADITNETFDVVIEAAGAKASVEQAMKIVKPGGALIEIGLAGENVDYSPIQIVRNEVTIFGSIIYTLQDFADAIEYLKNPTFNVDPVLSRVVPFSNFQQAFADAMSGNYAKIVLDFE